MANLCKSRWAFQLLSTITIAAIRLRVLLLQQHCRWDRRTANSSVLGSSLANRKLRSVSMKLVCGLSTCHCCHRQLIRKGLTFNVKAAVSFAVVFFFSCWMTKSHAQVNGLVISSSSKYCLAEKRTKVSGYQRLESLPQRLTYGKLITPSTVTLGLAEPQMYSGWMKSYRPLNTGEGDLK